MTSTFKLINRLYSTKNLIKPKICIVGAGPAGFYAAQHLLKKLKEPGSPVIDVYERLPVPFGLIRFGVAPDHPDVKNVIKTFTKTAQSPNFNFIGNVTLGKDITLEQLKKAYHVVVLTYGAEESKQLNVPGENLKNCIEARKIVGWYNGTPWDTNLDIDLSGEDVAIFGQGNVAVDIARILLTSIDELRKTDITEYSLAALVKSKVRKVYLIGRRGPLQAAYTIKELREMLRLKGCSTLWREKDFEAIAEHVSELERPRKRITELMLESLNTSKLIQGTKEFLPVFHRSPLQILGNDKVEGVILGVNRLEGEDLLKKSAVLTDAIETIDCSLAVPSIGYKSLQADPSIPFDHVQGVVRSTNCKIEKGVYGSGWLATGPRGVILTTMSNAFSVANSIIKDVAEENLVDTNRGGYEEISKVLQTKNIQVVNWQGWERIDKAEQEAGAKVGKPREKIVDVVKMLEIVAS